MADRGWDTELMIVAFEGEVARRPGGYVRAVWPAMPDFYWGNLLLLDAPPAPAEVAGWCDVFEREVGSLPGVRHVTIGWRGDHPGRPDPLALGAADRVALAAFGAAGFITTECVFLAAEDVAPPAGAAPPPTVTRPLASDADWAAAYDSQRTAWEPNIPRAAFDDFVRRRVAAWRRLCDRGAAAFFGAFLPDGALVGSCGVVVRPEDGLARYQSVVVAEPLRGRGVATHMVADAGRWALANLGARELVISAEAGTQAERIYARVGFRPFMRQLGAFKRPPPPSSP